MYLEKGNNNSSTRVEQSKQFDRNQFACPFPWENWTKSHPKSKIALIGKILVAVIFLLEGYDSSKWAINLSRTYVTTEKFPVFPFPVKSKKNSVIPTVKQVFEKSPK